MTEQFLIHTSLQRGGTAGAEQPLAVSMAYYKQTVETIFVFASAMFTSLNRRVNEIWHSE